MDAVLQWARTEGVFAAPEGAAALVAYQKLLASGFFSSDDEVVLFNTGSGLKYLELIDAHNHDRSKPTASR
jgi:threonine synthase